MRTRGGSGTAREGRGHREELGCCGGDSEECRGEETEVGRAGRKRAERRGRAEEWAGTNSEEGGAERGGGAEGEEAK